MKYFLQGLLTKQYDGIGVVEIILILVVLISLVLIFKTQITELIENIFETITGGSAEITG
ncbi:MAG: putative Flagellin, Flp1-like, domain [Herbinix sp.]|nr:putative Flagellin, Flp1-like, domain [Herbinix sp.]